MYQDYSLSAILTSLKKRLKILALLAIVAFCAAMFYFLTATRLYEASATIGPRETPGAGLGSSLSSPVAGLLGGGGKASQSPNFLAFIASLRSIQLSEKLTQDDYIMRSVFSSHWDAEANIWRAPSSIPAQVSQLARRLFGYKSWVKPGAYDLRSYIVATVNVQNLKDSSFLTVSFKFRDPDLAQYILEKIIDELDLFLRQSRLADLHSSEKILRERLSSNLNTTVVRDTLSELLNENLSRSVEAQSTEYYSIRVIDPVHVNTKPIFPRPSASIVASIMTSLAAIFGYIVFIGARATLLMTKIKIV